LGLLNGSEPEGAAVVKFVAVIRRIEQFAVQIAIDDTSGDLANLAHVGSKCFPPGLLRQPLRYGDHRDQHDGGGQASNKKRQPVESARNIRRAAI
jgi:hypothetical protein